VALNAAEPANDAEAATKAALVAEKLDAPANDALTDEPTVAEKLEEPAKDAVRAIADPEVAEKDARPPNVPD
jgi:hypothetical protein